MDPFCFRRQRVKAVLSLGAGLLLLAALAGPRAGRQFQEVRRRGLDVLVAVDVSESMLAEDIKPNRLTQAKRELSALLQRLEGDRVGLVAFAGSAFLQCPLTLDYGAAQSLLELIDTELIPMPGTSLAAAVEAACDSFPAGRRQYKVLVLLTDGEDHSGKLPAALKRAQEEGVRVFAIGFGSPKGEIIPLRDEQGGVRSYKRDKSGQTVVSRLNEPDLRDLAAKTGGRYYRATRGEVEVDRLIEDLRDMEKRLLESRVYGQTADRYQLPLALAVLLLLLEFPWPETGGHFRWCAGRLRGTLSLFRSKSVPAAGILLLTLLADARAMGRADRAYARGDYARAADDYAQQAKDRPDDPQVLYNLGNTLYRQEDFPAAQEAFDRAHAFAKEAPLQGRSAYNAGNACFRQKKMGEAAERYKETLRRDPDDLDAKYNLELAQRFLEKTKSEESGKPGQPDKKPSPPKPTGADENKREPKPDRQEMSKEDAERLLQAVEDQEKEARKALQRAAPPEIQVERDW